MRHAKMLATFGRLYDITKTSPVCGTPGRDRQASWLSHQNVRIFPQTSLRIRTTAESTAETWLPAGFILMMSSQVMSPPPGIEHCARGPPPPGHLGGPHLAHIEFGMFDWYDQVMLHVAPVVRRRLEAFTPNFAFKLFDMFVREEGTPGYMWNVEVDGRGEYKEYPGEV
ncbi:hypothetical protein NUW54_g2629 [Trametes sanguinea]|uniref:Uncharacterized protein n=1 Tax=Trametes sanguinea TaxID=158606 RepID=A0ACC1Q4P8_9APHY|nr:hypothetical protein NUW54_g2629 [Trametes sanguinea]